MDEARRKWAKELLEQVRENLRRLRECEGPHDFGSPEEQTTTPLVREFVCKKCGGSINRAHISWYLEGVKHGRAEALRRR
jgi:hypothetical protein